MAELTIRRKVVTRRLQRDLNRLIDREPRARERLPPVESPGPLAGRGAVTAAELAKGDTAGIASPLTEQARVTSTITLTIEGTDGEVDVEQIDEITFLDAAGREVKFILDHPPP